jgi:hypothetical protein
MARKTQDTMCNNKREARHTLVVPASERLFNTYCVYKNAAFLKEKKEENHVSLRVSHYRHNRQGRSHRLLPS